MQNLLLLSYLKNDVATFKSLLESANNSHTLLPVSRTTHGKQNLRQAVNQKDYLGRTILHVAASDGRLEFVQALINDPSVDISITDTESGWTALHRALYSGHISCAQTILSKAKRLGRGRDAIKTKDAESNSPFDVFNSTVEGTNPNGLDTIKGGTDLYTFGSNANHTLGFADSDDRNFPERVHVMRKGLAGESAIHKFRPSRIRDVQVCKFHTVVLTADTEDNTYVCGFANNGRLGVGGGTQFTLKSVNIGAPVSVIAGAQDHTIAICRGGDVYTWGSQKYGQLGYDLEDVRWKEEPYSANPRRILKLVKEYAVGAAASAVHSVIFTLDSLWTWGLNEGQLGYPIVPAEGPIQFSPRKVTSLPGPVKLATATRRATVCLLETNDVIVFASFGYFKLSLQLDRFATQYTVFRPRQIYAPNTAVKVASGENTVAVLTSMGDVFSFVIEDHMIDIKPMAIGKALKPQRVWNLRKKHMAVRDVDVGQSGAIIICTESGSVWTRTKRNPKQNGEGQPKDYKFSRVPNVNRVVAVRASDNGSYAVIRDDVEVSPVLLTATSLSEDLLCILPYASEVVEDEDEIQQVKGPDQSGLEEDDDDEEQVPKHVLNSLEWLRNPNFNDDWRAEIDRNDLVFRVDGKDVPAHQSILKVRCPFIKSVLSNRSPITSDACSVSWKDNTAYIDINQVSLASFVILLHWVYTDILLEVWKGGPYKIPLHLKDCMQSVKQLAVLFQCKPLMRALSTSFTANPKPSLATDIKQLLTQTDSADIVLQLADGTLPCHSVIMSARSEFFDAMFAGAWVNARREGLTEETRIEIDLKHVRCEVMTMVLNHIYGDIDVDIFAATGVSFRRFTALMGVAANSLEEFLDFVVEVLAAATELLLRRLQQACQAVIQRYLSLRTICYILGAADLYNAEELKEACLQYCCQNIETLLENNILDGLSSEVLHDLDLAIQGRQLQRLPISKSGRLLSELIQRHPDLLEKMQDASETQLRRLQNDDMVQKKFVTSSYGSPPTLALFPQRNTEARSEGKRRQPLLRESPPASPQTRGNDRTDLMFNMEEYDLDEVSFDKKYPKAELVNPVSSSASVERPVRQSNSQQPSSDPWRSGSECVAPLAFDNEQNSETYVQMPNKNLLATTTNETTPAKSESRGWSTFGTPKQDLRAIMIESQTKPTTSGLSFALREASSPTAPDVAYKTPTRMSQKERKQMTASNGSPVTSHAPTVPVLQSTSASSPAWQKTAAPSVPLKDIISNESVRASTITTTRRTVLPSSLPNSSPKNSPFLPSPSPSMRGIPVRSVPAAKPATQARSVSGPVVSVAAVSVPGKEFATGKAGRESSAFSLSLSGLSLSDIIEHERREKQKVVAYKQKRSMKEIQEQEAFEIWWAEESARARAEEEAATAALHVSSLPKNARTGPRSRPKGERTTTGAANERGGKQASRGKRRLSNRENQAPNVVTEKAKLQESKIWDVDEKAKATKRVSATFNPAAKEFAPIA